MVVSLHSTVTSSLSVSHSLIDLDCSQKEGRVNHEGGKEEEEEEVYELGRGGGPSSEL
jgi:hypothetical protein